VTLSRDTLVALIVRQTTVAKAAGEGAIAGDATLLAKLFDALDDFELMFDILTP